MRTTLGVTRPVSYRPARPLGVPGTLTVKDALREAVTRARDTTTAPGRVQRANDIARGRPFDLVAIEHVIADLVEAGASRESVLAIGHAVVRVIEARLPAPPLTLAEAQHAETHADGLLDEAQIAVAYAPRCPSALARLRDRITSYAVALADLATSLHRA